MKLNAAQIDRFLQKPDAKVRLVLLYGPDSGLMKERSKQIALTICDDLNDPFRVSDLSTEQILEDPARLLDEAAAQSLMGGTRLIRVFGAGDKLSTAVKNFLENVTDDNDSLTIVEAGDLGAASSLRKLCEKSTNTACIPCYVEDESQLGRTITNILASEGLGVTPDARDLLARLLVGDRQMARNELEKLMTYMGIGTSKAQIGMRITLEDVKLMIGDSSTLELDEPVQAACLGDIERVDISLAKLFSENISPVALIRTLQRHFQKLQICKFHMKQGASADIAMGKLRPPIFFKQKNGFKLQLSLWSDSAIQKVLEQCLDLEAKCKMTGQPDLLLIERFFLSLANMAKRQKGRSGYRPR